MPLEAAQLIKDDQDHLIHPLHHPSDHLEPMVYVRGRGAVLTDVQGREYIDGLAGLWNVNVGHGRAELADAAAEQMRDRGEKGVVVREQTPAAGEVAEYDDIPGRLSHRDIDRGGNRRIDEVVQRHTLLLG